MAVPLLLVTPQAAFGALIRKELDLAQYDLLVTADFSDAIHHVRRTNCPVAILDAELEDIELSLVDIGFALRQIKENIQYILVKRSDQELDVSLLAPAATFIKPLVVAELSQSINKILTPATGVSMSTQKPELPQFDPQIRTLAETSRLVWIQDVSKAAQHLTRLTLESSAQAALITRESELWAYAGQLSRDAAQELAQSLPRYWDRENESDILRFVRLQSTESQHILYARKLSSSMILAMVFDGETSFSTIRSQAGKLVKNLSSEPVEDVTPPPQTPPAAVFEPIKDDYSSPDDMDEELPPISELLGDVPPPIPVRPITMPRTSLSLPWEQPVAPVATDAPRMAIDEPKTEPPKTLQSPPPVIHFSQEKSPAVRREAIRRPIPAMDETMAARLPAGTDTQTEPPAMPKIPDELQATRKQEQKDQALIETRPQSIAESVTQVAHRILLEPASPAMADLAYACLLVPRFDFHHLVGDAADRLTEWVPQVCIAFGWRLEYISVRPDYLQWVTRVPPSTAPGQIMRLIRQQTSDRLFIEFPRFKKDNPSSDFWAPGYLIMGSSQPHPQNLVRTFIKQTRERQGLSQDE